MINPESVEWQTGIHLTDRLAAGIHLTHRQAYTYRQTDNKRVYTSRLATDIHLQTGNRHTFTDWLATGVYLQTGWQQAYA